MDVGVKELVRKLCRCLLNAAFHSAIDRDTLLSSLQAPSKSEAWDTQKREREVVALVHLAFDLLLLRKWAWFGSREATPLSPLCWCLAYGYEYQAKGKKRVGKRLMSTLRSFSC